MGFHFAKITLATEWRWDGAGAAGRWGRPEKRPLREGYTLNSSHSPAVQHHSATRDLLKLNKIGKPYPVAPTSSGREIISK